MKQLLLGYLMLNTILYSGVFWLSVEDKSYYAMMFSCVMFGVGLSIIVVKGKKLLK